MTIKFDANFEYDDRGKRELERRIEDAKTSEVSLDELFNVSFMTTHTSYTSVESMFEAAGVTISTEEALQIPTNEKLNCFIAENTKFEDWNDMVKSAGAEYLKRKLGLG